MFLVIDLTIKPSLLALLYGDPEGSAQGKNVTFNEKNYSSQNQEEEDPPPKKYDI